MRRVEKEGQGACSTRALRKKARGGCGALRKKARVMCVEEEGRALRKKAGGTWGCVFDTPPQSRPK